MARAAKNLPPEAPDAARALAKILGADMRGATIRGPFVFADGLGWPSNRLEPGAKIPPIVSLPRDEAGGTDQEDRDFAELVAGKYVWLLLEDPEQPPEEP